MYRFIILFFVIAPLLLTAQSLKKIKKESYQTLAFKINAATAENYIRKNKIDIDLYASQEPFHVFESYLADANSLPVGHYVFLTIKDSVIKAELVNNSNLFVYTINNQKHVQIEVRNKQSIFIENAKVFVNNKLCKYNNAAHNYTVLKHNPDEAFGKIYTTNDTLFFSLAEKDDWRKPEPAFLQKWKIFKRSKFYTTISWVPKKINGLFKKHSSYKSYSSPGTHGLIVFNQPKYKLNDTVRLKGYLYDHRNKLYKKSIGVYLDYYKPSRESVSQKLADLLPTENGSFIYEFILRDTLINDISYSVIFKNNKNQNLVRNSFNTEDYVLDDVATFSLRSEKEDYYKNDTLKFYANAKDANGLNVLDGTAKLVLTTSSIDKFFTNELQVPDTLFTEEKKLETQGDTKFTIPSKQFPDANLSINATLILKNSNNELQEKSKPINFKSHSKEVIVKQVADTIYAITMMDGKPVIAKGEMETDGIPKGAQNINFPFKIKIDPFITEYDFYWYEKDSLIESESFEMKSGYRVSLAQISKEDTLGFTLYNPNKIPVNYSVFKNNKLEVTGKGSSEIIEWEKVVPNKHQMYTIKWQYFWEGKEINNSENIGLLYKLLDVKIKAAASIFPGQKDSIEISVSDYKKQPASNINLTAFSYNNQFKQTKAVPEPPYLQHYKLKPQILNNKYEVEDAYITHDYLLGKHTAFIKKFAIDTMLYYQILFPSDSVKDVSTARKNYSTEVSVHAVDGGVPQQIFILYLNNRPVYYYNTTGQTPYAFGIMPGYTKIGIRLFNKYIELDSVYVQPFYKHDFIFDVNKLPANAKIISTENYLSDFEKSQLEHSLFQFDVDYKTINSFLWQNDRVVWINSNQKNILGPFAGNDSIHFYAPERFDVHFIFEPTYRYRLSDKILRLEKNNIFPVDEKYYLTAKKDFALMLGDTLEEPPTVSYFKPLRSIRFIATDDFKILTQNESKPCGKLQLEFKKDTLFFYAMLKPLSNNNDRIVRYYTKKINSIPEGKYQLLLVMRDLSAVEIDSIEIKRHTTFCKKINQLNFRLNNSFVEKIANESERGYNSFETEKPKIISNPIEENLPKTYPSGTGHIHGKIVDAKGKLPISGVTIMIKSTKSGTSSSANGDFSFNNIKSGKYVLIISSIGYVSKEISVNVSDYATVDLNISLAVTNQSLQEVVVIGYGTTMKKSLTAASVTIQEPKLFNVNEMSLQGRVAGVSITNEGEPGNAVNIRIRGISTLLAESSSPIYVIDGIIYNEIPNNISPEMIENIEVLKDAAATAIYGDRGINGVIVISTKSKTIRQQFRDYAFWKPELITDQSGKIKFEVTYPDNITAWKTYVLAMDKKLRIGKTAILTQSYKPVLAQLSVPQFLIEGDTAAIIGKSLNYTNDLYNIKTKFLINGIERNIEKNILQPKASLISSSSIYVTSTDTVKTSYNLQTETGFKDGEERKIPVYRKGVEESAGQFLLLNNDTTTDFTINKNKGSTYISADNKTLDILLNEIKHLKEYPFACMEQTASKLSGLLMEKSIRNELREPFKDEKLIKPLLEKLLKAQQFDGGWAWWENGKADLYITNYIINSLLPLRADPLVETNIRNGLLFLQNQLNKLDKNQLLASLNTMSASGHSMDYIPYLQKINFDSLSLHQQWQWVFIQQKIKGEYRIQLKQLIEKQKATMLGGIYWGSENYLWYSNAVATTILAYKVLQNENEYKNLLPFIIQYFLEMRQNGFWRNTVESASILSTILPQVMNDNKNFTKPVKLKVSGDTSFTINSFPQTTFLSSNIKNISVTKSGGGLTYLSVYQKWFNKIPEAVNDKFEIKTYFKKNNEVQQYIPVGEKIKMIVEVFVKKDAEYVMLQIPIPAGCNYASKIQDRWNMHKEFFKDKVVMFAEKLTVGKYVYEIELESRYNGNFTLNPCKAELMYFPVFFGRNEVKHVELK